MRVLVGLLGMWLLWTVVRNRANASPAAGAEWDDALAPLSPLLSTAHG